MGVINEEFNLKENVSPKLDKMLGKMEKVENSWEKLISMGKAYEKEERQMAQEDKMAYKLSNMTDAMLKARGATQQQIDELRLWRKEQDEIAKQNAFAESVHRSVAATDEMARATENMADGADKASRSEDVLEKKSSRLYSTLKKIGRGAKSAVSGLLGFGKAKTPLDGVANKLTRMAASLFTVRKLIRYIKDGMERAPDEIGQSFSDLGAKIKDSFAGVIVSLMRGLQPAVDRLKQTLDSPGGQRFLKGLERIAYAAGAAIGWLADKVGVLVEWIGNNWNVVMPVAIGLLGLFAAKMLAAAAATLAANWPLLLIVGTVAAVIAILVNLGVTAETVFGYIGGAISVVAAFFENLAIVGENTAAGLSAAWGTMADNTKAAGFDMASYIEYSFYDMILAVIDHLGDLVDFVNGILGSIPGVGLIAKGAAPLVRGLIDQEGLSAFADKTIRAKRDAIGAEHGYSSPGDAFNEAYGSGKTAFEDGWAEKAWATGEAAGKAFGKTVDGFLGSFDPDNLDKFALQDIKVSADSSAGSLGGIGSSVGNIEKAVTMAEEDIKALVDMAERRFVNNVNLTSQAPVIQITGANTGNTAEDRKAIADAIKTVLMEQISSSSFVSTVVV